MRPCTVGGRSAVGATANTVTPLVAVAPPYNQRISRSARRARAVAIASAPGTVLTIEKAKTVSVYFGKHARACALRVDGRAR